MSRPTAKRFTQAHIQAIRIVSLFVVCGTILRLPNLNESLWYDELWSTRVMLGNVRDLAFQAVFDVHPPAYSVVMYLWINVFGDSEVSVRIPPLLFGIATIVLTYILANYAAGRSTALLSTFLLAISPVHIWYSQEARQYSMLLCAVLLAIVSKIKLNETRPNQIWFALYAVAVSICVFGHYYLVAYIFLISMILVAERHLNTRRLLVLNGAVVLFYCLFLGVKFSFAEFKTGLSYARPFSLSEFYQLFFNWFFLGGTWDQVTHWWFLLVTQLFGAALFVRGIVRLYEKRGERNPFEFVLYLFLLPVGMLVLSFVGLQNYIERSVLAAFPFFTIVLSAGAIGFKSKVAQLAIVSLLLSASVSTTVVYFNRQDVWTVYKPNPDWRSASKYLEDEISMSTVQPVILTVTPADELRYYGKHFELKVLSENAGLEKTTHDQVSVYRLNRMKIPQIYDALVRENGRHFYLLRNLYWLGDFDAVLSGVNDDGRYTHTSVRSFKGLEIHRFDLANPHPSVISISSLDRNNWRLNDYRR